MIPADFQDYFVNSSTEKQGRIIDQLLSLATSASTLHDMDDRKAISCPYCHSKDLVANRRVKSIQRFRCKSCGKNFRETTGKFWYNLKKRDKVSKYLHCLLSGYSIRKSAKETGISTQTSFNWRHKLLSSFSHTSPEKFAGIVENGDIFFRHSEKGNRYLSRPARQRGRKANKPGVSDEHVAVIVTCDRSGNKDFKVAIKNAE